MTPPSLRYGRRRDSDWTEPELGAKIPVVHVRRFEQMWNEALSRSRRHQIAVIVVSVKARSANIERIDLSWFHPDGDGSRTQRDGEHRANRRLCFNLQPFDGSG